jgi:hypothetical protein
LIQINEDSGAAPPRVVRIGNAFRSAKQTDAAGKVVDVVAGREDRVPPIGLKPYAPRASPREARMADYADASRR